nr:pathogenesis-related protein PRB1-3-like [Setaria viridis]
MARSNDGAATLELVPHNAARAEVGVPKLSWNATLAAYTRRYAGRRAHDCELVHSRGPYGENIFWGSASRDWAAGDAVASWVKERANYVRLQEQPLRAAAEVCSGHYTQVMARTKRVGCATVAARSSSAAMTRRATSMGSRRTQAAAVMEFRPSSDHNWK